MNADNDDLVQKHISLEPGGIVRVEGAPGIVVQVDAGTIWLTQTCDPNDICLKAGQSFRLDRIGAVLISARRGGAVRLIDGTRETPHKTLKTWTAWPAAATAKVARIGADGVPRAWAVVRKVRNRRRRVFKEVDGEVFEVCLRRE